jgi:electron transport complex protein RnfB
MLASVIVQVPRERAQPSGLRQRAPYNTLMAREAKAAPVAVIDEETCIGCTLCIEACPVDAIVGAARLMHTVIAAECTGCRLCVPPCPVDCITMVETGEIWTHEERRRRASQYRRRRQARSLRLERERAAQRARGGGKAAQRRKRETIERAMRRARERLRRG